MKNTPTARDIASEWLTRYANAMFAGDVANVGGAILPFGWLRDILTFTWDYRALEGTNRIVNYLSENLKPGDVSDFKLVEDKFCSPEYVELRGWIEAVFTYETRTGHGRGMVRLLQEQETGSWKALSVCMMMDDLKRYEEAGPELGLYGGHTLAWSDVLRERQADTVADPYVLIGEYTS